MVVKQYNRTVSDAGRMDKLQELTAASTGTEITNYGVTLIDSTQVKTFELAAPRAGLRKGISVVGDSTSTIIDGNGATIAGSTSLDLDGNTGVELIGASTGAWARLS